MRKFGYDVALFEDSVMFRYIYESKYRRLTVFPIDEAKEII